ncbi:hypothetical protein GQ457_HM001310 [Hibiscus cannabinus]
MELKQPNKQEVKINQRTKIKFDSGICILVRIVSEANKTNYLHSCVPIASQAASVLAASVHGACESRQASPGKLVLVVEIMSTSEHHQARSGTSVSVILILMFIDIY